jgi:hypothetical protein
MNAEEKYLLDGALVVLIIVLVWMGLPRNRQDERDERGRDNRH